MTFDEWWQKEGIPIQDDEYFSRSDMRWIAELAWKQAMLKAVSVFLHPAKEQKMRRIFIRFGDIPDSFKSKNHLTEKLEVGVSVYDAGVLTADGKKLYDAAERARRVEITTFLSRAVEEIK